MKFRSSNLIGGLLAALTLLFITACDSGTLTVPVRPTEPKTWSPPTPFPPVQYPTEAPAPGLPPALEGHQPLPAATSQAEYAPIQGRVAQQLLQIEKDAAQVRGLNPTSDVQENFIDKEQLRSNMLNLQDRSYSSREQARQAETQLWLLRLIEQPTIDLFQMQADMLSNALAGYYDPTRKELFVLSGATDLDPEAKATLAHEYVHSLQDQHYDLQSILNREGSADTDGLLAARSLVEGDASLSEVLYADQYLSTKEFDKLVEDSLSYGSSAGQVPNIFDAELHFPYTYGTDFVKALYTRGGFETVNRALADPPVSTEQILHPEKYLSAHRDLPLPVGVPPLTSTLGTGWTYRFTETMGEFELGVLLKDQGVKNADQAVLGWGGGQADLYENGPNSLLLMGTRWDTQQDAVTFERALRQSLALVGRYGPDWSDGVRYFNIKRIRDKVWYCGSTDQAMLAAVLNAVK